jgi:hypothetical protein
MIAERAVRLLGEPSQAEARDPYLPWEEPMGTVYQRARSATNFAEVFERIHVPPPEDALDSL